MAQLTIRLDEGLARAVKAQAEASGRSMNGWVAAVLAAAVDPELEDSEAARTRARLERAGLLATPSPRLRVSAPDRRRVARARKAAGKGTPPSRLVSDGRG